MELDRGVLEDYIPLRGALWWVPHLSGQEGTSCSMALKGEPPGMPKPFWGSTKHTLKPRRTRTEHGLSVGDSETAVPCHVPNVVQSLCGSQPSP